jgi:hypothetical protein
MRVLKSFGLSLLVDIGQNRKTNFQKLSLQYQPPLLNYIHLLPCPLVVGEGVIKLTTD